MLGVLVLLVPIGLTHWSNVEQHAVAERYSQHSEALPAADRASALAAAREYNRKLGQHPLADPWGSRPDPASPEYREYLAHLHGDAVMARIRITSVGIDVPVYHGTDDSTLAAGVGHVFGSALPVGGDGTHAVLAGHTGLVSSTMFDNLSHVAEGDLIVIEVMGEQLAYRVDRRSVVLPSEFDAVQPEVGHDRITLVTCTPYGINTHRLLVRAERTELPNPLPPQTYFSPWQPWMIAALVIALAALLYLIWWLLRRRRREDEEPHPSAARTRKESA